MIIYRSNEPFQFKKSKVMEALCKMAAGLLLGLAIFFLCGSINEIGCLITELKSDTRNLFEGYYYFQPVHRFWQENQRYVAIWGDPQSAIQHHYVDLVEKWQKERGLKIMRYNTYYYMKTEEYWVYTYYVPESYEVEWDGIELEMKKGEWFKEGEESLILIKGKGYKIGDTVKIIDPNGTARWLPITGIAKENYLVTTNSSRGIVLREVYTNGGAAFLLNPFCDLNPKTDYMDGFCYGCFKDDNYLLRKEIEEYGLLKPVKVTDSHGRKINQRDAILEMGKDAPFLLRIGNYIAVFHLWYIPLFPICAAGLFVLIYYLNQWNFAKRIWIYLALGTWIFQWVILFSFPSIDVGKAWICWLCFLVVLVYDIIIKKNTVHGRSYIVDGWDETDVDI